MVSVHDVVKYILDELGKMTTMKLQKIVYYAQAWSLVWDNEPLFAEEIQAWENGPVVPSLFHAHKGLYEITPPWPEGNTGNLKEYQRATIDAVIDFYGKMSPQELSDLTHREPPWQNARRSEKHNKEISYASMIEYYGNLASNG